MIPDPMLVDELHRHLVETGGNGAAALDGLGELTRRRAPLLSDADVDAVVAAVVARVEGIGPIQRFLTDADVTDVLVNGAGPVWIERYGRLERTDVSLTRDEVDLVVERVLAPLDRRADRAHPIAEARLPDGSRVHIVLAPVAVDGPCVAIRRFAAGGRSIDDFASAPVGRLLADAVADRRNIIVSGGTGSGKTTLLGSLARHIDDAERVITIEDAAELRLPGSHIVRFESRPVTGEGTGAVDVRDLVRCALRLRPDRLVVGEVRGGEAFDLVQALNTGHDGSLATCHANDAPAALRRIETLAVAGTPAVPHQAIRELLAVAVDLVVQVARADGEHRRVVAVHEVAGTAPDGAITTRVLVEGERVIDTPHRTPRCRR